jgi:hypothetical protein
MIRIVRTRTLRVLRAEADGRDEAVAMAVAASDEAGELRSRAEAAEADRDQAKQERDAVWNDSLAAVCRLQVQASEPRTGRSIIGEIALRILRNWIADARASGDEELIRSIRVMDNLLGEEGVLETGHRLGVAHAAGEHAEPDPRCHECRTVAAPA